MSFAQKRDKLLRKSSFWNRDERAARAKAGAACLCGATQRQRKGTEMVRFVGVLFLAGVLTGNIAFGQCRGGTGQGTTGTTGTTGVLTGTAGLNGGASVLTGPGSLAYDLMLQQAFMQQMAQRQMMLAQQQQQMRQEKLAARRYRAEQTRTQVAESRARTRAALAAKNGLTPAKQPQGALVAFDPVKR
jgi:hypothetical protein